MKLRKWFGSLICVVVGVAIVAAILLSLVVHSYAQPDSETAPVSGLAVSLSAGVSAAPSNAVSETGSGSLPASASNVSGSESEPASAVSSIGTMAAGSDSVTADSSRAQAVSSVSVPSAEAIPAAASPLAQVVLSRKLPDGSAITVTVPASAFPGTDLGLLTLSVKEESQQKAVSTLLNRAAISKHKRIVSYRLFDITLLLNGGAVEPSGTVQVVFSGVKTIGKAAQDIYHVDAVKNTVDDMGASMNRSTGAVTIKTPHFSTYAAALTATTSTATTSAAAIAQGLGVARKFSVFAQNFTLQGDMEGSVAVNSFTYKGGESGTSANIITGAQALNLPLTVTINAGSANAYHWYSFGVYKDAASSKVTTVTLQTDSSGNGSKTVNVSGSYAYYVYRLDSFGNPILDSSGQSIVGGGAVPIVYDTNYINTFTQGSTLGGPLFYDPGSNCPVTAIFGTAYRLFNGSIQDSMSGDYSYGLYTYPGHTKIVQNNLGNSGVKAYIASDSNPMIDFDTTFSSLKSFSASLSSAGDCDTTNMKVLNVTPTGNGDDALKSALAQKLGIDPNYLDNQQYGIPLSSTQYLLINVDCAHANGSVTIPRCAIGGDTGATISTSYGTVSRVIWNFFDSDNSMDKTFSGTVNVGYGALGTLLAPSGSVSVNASPMNGAIYANTVSNPGAEIHQIPFQPPAQVTFGVPVCLTVTKVWKSVPNGASLPCDVTVDLYRNGVLVATQKLTASGGWKYTFQNLDPNATYQVVEEAVSGYTASYSYSGFSSSSSTVNLLCCPSSSSSCSSTKQVTITNTYNAGFILPAAGGWGTRFFTATGCGILILAGLLLIVYGRKRTRSSG